jgi:predicted dienelactone hydrolase
VIFSHGNSGVRTQSVFLTETLASHGFVVASPDHVGNTAADVIAGTEVEQVQAAFDRPADVSLVIEHVLNRANDVDHPLRGHVDETRIGMTGHSFGALTSFLVASPRDGQPLEPRISAIAPIAPVSFPLSDEALAAITLPTMLVAGTDDTQMPIDPETVRPWELLGSDTLYRVDVQGAGHMAFSHICEITDAFTEAGEDELVVFLEEFSDGACDPDAVPVPDIHRLTARYVVAFFLVELAGDESAAEFLGPTEGAEFMERSR